jgi:hypothetical protein
VGAATVPPRRGEASTGIDRLIRRNVIAMSGPGSVDCARFGLRTHHLATDPRIDVLA